LGKQRYLLYVAAQLLGAICGSALLRLSLPPSYLETPFVTAGSATAAHPIQVFLLEFTCTFVLVYVVFATVVDKAGAAKVLTPPPPFTHPHLFTLCICTARTDIH
jgi:glycerol uptake facilitator-like aquaporin